MKHILLLLLLLSPLFANEKLAMVYELPDSADTKEYNPLLTTGLSLIPGGGQIYTGHMIRGPLFLGSEIILGSVAFSRWQRYRDNYDLLYEAEDSLRSSRDKFHNKDFGTPTQNFEPELEPDPLKEGATAKDSTKYTEQKKRYDRYEKSLDSLNKAIVNYNNKFVKDTVLALNDYKLAEYDNREAKYSYYNYATWFGGIYLWNLADGFGVANRFKGVKNPNPKKAAWLSAIPFTGAGQLYNGDIFKAGLVSTMELGCLFSALRYMDLMDFAEEGYRAVANDSNSVKILTDADERKEWQNRYEDAAKIRTRFIWYGVIFYIYGIFDAYVDAELYEFRDKFDILATYDPITEDIGFNLTIGF